MNFKTPNDRITKDMMMDYQQKVQEKFFTDAAGSKVLYDQTGLTATTVTPTLIPYAPTGLPATKADVQTEKKNLKTLYADLDTFKKITKR